MSSKHYPDDFKIEAVKQVTWSMRFIGWVWQVISVILIF